MTKGMRRHLSAMYAMVVVLLFSAMHVPSQDGNGGEFTERANALVQSTPAKSAFEFIDRNRSSILAEWIAVTEINAPSGQEHDRAVYIERLLRQYKLQQIRYDSAGNLI